MQYVSQSAIHSSINNFFTESSLQVNATDSDCAAAASVTSFSSSCSSASVLVLLLPRFPVSRIYGLCLSCGDKGSCNSCSFIQDSQPRVIIVEEAADILEPQVVACLGPWVQHLVLLGDHRQLQPTVNNWELVRSCNLHISLLERLINNQLPHVTLEYQRRMHPLISACVRPLCISHRMCSPLITNPFCLSIVHFLLPSPTRFN